MDDPHFLAIDIGTSSTKAALYNARGEQKAIASSPHQIDYPHNGWAEQNAEDWWEATRYCIQNIKNLAPCHKIAAIAVSGQTPSCLPIDRQGNPLRPAILWLDRRSTDQVETIHKVIGPEQAFKVGGNRIDSYFGGPKWLWYQQNQPDLYRKTWKILQAIGFITYRLTGELTIDPSQAGLCGPFFNLGRRGWDAEISDSLGMDIEKLPEIKASSQVIGEVIPAVANNLGLSPGTPVLCGGGDFAFSCLGAGAYTAGVLALMLGTSGNLLIPEPSGADARLFNTYHVTGGRLSLGGVFAGGAVKWVAGILQPTSPEDFQKLDLLAEDVPSGSEGLIFLPYLTGERSPIWDPYARGVFFGLSTRHTRAQLYRAVLEGVAYGFRRVFEIVQTQGTAISRIIATDGGSRSLTWLRILATVLQQPIYRRQASNDTLKGAAFLAAYGSGEISSFSKIEDWLSPLEVIQPDTSGIAPLMKNYRIFLELYDRNADLFRSLA